MSENLKTIKELADEFNVSKQAVRKRLTEEFRANHVETITSNGVKTLVVTYTSNPTTGDLSVVKILEQQLFVKDKQLENKDSQISQMQNLLDQQQRLALQDKKLLEEYKSEINELKALKMPQEDMKDGSSIRGEAQEEIERLKAQLKLSEEERNKAKEKEPVKTESKKWWQRWK